MAIGPGSIAFVGFNADGNDNLAFVVLEPIVAGTVIYFQDNEWNGSAIGAGGAFNSDESAWHWIASTDIAAGTVVTIDNIGSGTATSNGGTVVFDDDGNRGLSNGGDTVYAYVGSSSSPTAFLTAVTSGSFGSDGSLANTGLTAGVNALEFGGDRDIFTFNGARGGEAAFADYAASINSPSNWIFQDGGGDQSADGTAPNVPFSLAAFSIAAVTPELESITLASATVAEGGAVDVTIALSAPADVDTVVSLAFVGDAGDLGSLPASVTVAAGTTTAVVTLVVGDDVDTQDDAFTVVAALNGNDKQATGTIIDNDGPASTLDIDLSQYVRVGRYALPEPTRTSAPSGNLLAQEASGVTYNWDTDTLFIVGDGGRSVTEVSKTGELISTMTLAAGSSPQGTDFYDPEGVTYIGNGEFVFTEERDRQIVKFTYEAGTTLHRADTQTVDLGTFVDNTGLEGLSYDPQTGGFILVKETSPEGIFQTDVDFAAGTATNGSPTTENSINLFDPALTGLSDFADVFALSNLPGLGSSQSGDLLVLSQQDGRIVMVDRDGNVLSSLQIVADVGSPLSVADQQHEGITMDRDGNIYIVNENGGGDIDHPQLWVYAKSSVPNQAPTGVVLNNGITSLVENTATAVPVKVADIVVVDDGLGTNQLTLTGDDAAFFDIISGGLYIKAGTVLDYEAKTSYSVTVNVDDASLGTNPDATADFTLAVTDVVDETPVVPSVFISEVHPSGSGNGSYSADWFEVTNTGSDALDVTGWQMDDSSNGSGKVVLRGVTSIASGQSVIFIEGTADGSTDAALIAEFSTAWFGSATLPAGVLVGVYGGSGVGLSTGGDAVNLFDAAGNRVTGVSFGAATDGVTFDNHAGLGSDTLPLPTVSDLSSVGVDGAFRSADNAETGSPGAVGTSAPEIDLRITEVAPWSSGDSPVGADWFEVTNFGATAVDLAGWRMDDSSQSFVGSVALNGVTSIAPGESVIFIESSSPGTAIANFINTWFGGNAPAGLQIGTYSGSGVGLSTDGDAVNLYDSSGALQASVNFGASDSTDPLSTFDNAAGADNATISQLSAVGTNGADVAAGDPNEIGSPGTTVSPPPEVDVRITEVAPWSSGNSPVGADWFELTNFGDTAIDLTGWRMDDNSHAFGSAVALHGITTLAAGESVIFIESGSPSITASFLETWFGGDVPAGLQIGTYSGSGVGLSTGGDEVNIYDSTGTLQANVGFGASDSSAPYSTFDNTDGLNNATLAQLSAAGVNGAFTAADASEIGSPGQFNDTIVNFDAITDGVYTGVGDDTLINHGMIASPETPAIDLGAGRDTFVLGESGSVTGNILLGDGSDTATIMGAAASVAGGAGDDFYYVGNASVAIVENAGEGFDRVFAYTDYALAQGAEVEWLQAGLDSGVTLSGNELDNSLVGGGGDDTLNGDAGNDTLGGLGGADTLNGGEGDDTYYVDGVDTVTELAGQGYDTVFAAADFALAEGSEVEVLRADAGSTGLTLTGNEFDNGLVGGGGDDTLNGDAGNDTLNGLGGADTLNGGEGDDTYYVDGADTVVEAAGQGYDKVFATADHTLAAGSEVEWLQAAAGDTGLTLTGNELANAVLGGAGADTLDGGAGADQLHGGEGGDSFVFNFGEANGDTVVDFAAAAGDVLDFFGYGAGATLTQVGETDSWTITADEAHGSATETITLTNVFSLNTQDYLFH